MKKVYNKQVLIWRLKEAMANDEISYLEADKLVQNTAKLIDWWEKKQKAISKVEK